MIVKPDFLDHFKTQALVKLTKDEAAPLSVLRLWGHCERSRRWQFEGMTAEQLATLCAWGNRKPACHTALIKAGFIKRLPEGGFEAHQWDEQNKSLIQKWQAGKLGGRPKEGEKTNRPKTERLSTENRSKTDQTRLDQIGVDQRSKPIGRSGEVGEMQEGGISAAQSMPPSGDASGGKEPALWVVPVFEPLPEGAFMRELETMLTAARKQLKALRGDARAWEWSQVERHGYAADLRWYEEEIANTEAGERKEKLTVEMKELMTNRTVKERTRMRSDAHAVERAWEGRVSQIEKAMAGVRE